MNRTDSTATRAADDCGDEHQPPRARSMTSGEVLTVLLDLWRQREGVDPGEHIELPLQRSTPVETAANLIGLPKFHDDWPAIATFLQNWLRTSFDAEQWRAVLHPKQSKTLGPVCDLIAAHALAPAIEREFNGVRLTWAAAAFRAVIGLMHESGIPTDGITPQTKLARFIQTRPEVFMYRIARLAPGQMPAMRTINYGMRALLAGIGALTSIAILQWLFPAFPWPTLGRFTSPALVVVFIGGIALLSSQRVVRRRLGDLTTFRDLCYALTSPPPDSPLMDPLNDVTEVRWDASKFPVTVDVTSHFGA